MTKRREWTLAEKLEMVEEVVRGASRRAVAREHGATGTSVGQWASGKGLGAAHAHPRQPGYRTQEDLEAIRAYVDRDAAPLAMFALMWLHCGQPTWEEIRATPYNIASTARDSEG